MQIDDVRVRRCQFSNAIPVEMNELLLLRLSAIGDERLEEFSGITIDYHLLLSTYI